MCMRLASKPPSLTFWGAPVSGCLSEGQHVYLEATSQDNKRLYERHGFRY